MVLSSLYHAEIISSSVITNADDISADYTNDVTEFCAEIQKGTAAGVIPQQYQMRIIEINDIPRPGNEQSASDIPPRSCQISLQDRKCREIRSPRD
jgi:hypothetical protein